ncbi:MAG: hypothetical protein ABIE03_07865 [Patescibacteria group bacterium]
MEIFEDQTIILTTERIVKDYPEKGVTPDRYIGEQIKQLYKATDLDPITAIRSIVSLRIAECTIKLGPTFLDKQWNQILDKVDEHYITFLRSNPQGDHAVNEFLDGHRSSARTYAELITLLLTELRLAEQFPLQYVDFRLYPAHKEKLRALVAMPKRRRGGLAERLSKV